MPDRLVEYVQGSFSEDRAPVDEIGELADKVIGVLLVAFDTGVGAWPYELLTGKAVPPVRAGDGGFTFSTTAMIAYALKLADGHLGGSSLAPAVTRYRPADPKRAERQREGIDEVVSRAMDAVVKQSDLLHDPKNYPEAAGRRLQDPNPAPPLTCSLTFGWDDPFTLTWLIEVFAAQAPPHRFLGALKERARGLIEDVLKTPYDRDPAKPDLAPQPRRVLQVKEAEDVEHAFPLLRVLQLRDTLRRLDGDALVGDVSGAREYLLSRVHRQLSESQLRDGNFDPAELVFSLEGLLLASDAEPDYGLIDRVFAVMREQHERTPYWHPFRPFKATAQGLVLLPQSVEIANSMLRICGNTLLRQRGYFGEHAELFASYTTWLRRRTFTGLFTVNGESSELIGWESEFTHRLDRIHLWQTSQALIYLQHYAAMLREHLARRLVDLAGLRPVKLEGDEKPEGAWTKFRELDPMAGAVDVESKYLVYERIEADFVAPRVATPPTEALYSMLLYGPPGTGKSTIARELARRLEYRFLTITPSDFVASGGEEIEARAKALFAVLEQQTDLVVLFDEIDALLLDRNSELYREQGDVFRLLTPGMLTKLNDLAQSRAVVFAIATNYYERIDPAIKRPGRIDAHYLVLPPATTQRRNVLPEKLSDAIRARVKKLSDAPWDTLPQPEELVVSTARFTYAELEQVVVDVARHDPNAREDELQRALDVAVKNAAPLARASLYGPRLDNKKPGNPSAGSIVGATDFPWEEYALLAFLDIDASKVLSGDVADRLASAPLDLVVKDNKILEALRNALAKEGE